MLVVVLLGLMLGSPAHTPVPEKVAQIATNLPQLVSLGLGLSAIGHSLLRQFLGRWRRNIQIPAAVRIQDMLLMQ